MHPFLVVGKTYCKSCTCLCWDKVKQSTLTMVLEEHTLWFGYVESATATRTKASTQETQTTGSKNTPSFPLFYFCSGLYKTFLDARIAIFCLYWSSLSCIVVSLRWLPIRDWKKSPDLRSQLYMHVRDGCHSSSRSLCDNKSFIYSLTPQTLRYKLRPGWCCNK